jgi:hypothetical protein
MGRYAPWWAAPLVWLAVTPQAAAQAARPVAAQAAASPNIGIVLNGHYAHFSKDTEFQVPGFVLGGEPGPGSQGFNLGESELTLFGSIDPYFFGAATFALAPEEGVSVEEAYLQTTALPGGFTVKVGRFFSGIGYQNSRHRHADDFFDAPLPYQVFLGGQYGDDGAQVRWVAPVNFLLEAGLESFRGQSFPAGGAAKKGAGVGAGFLKLGGDLGENASWLLNISQLQARALERATGDDADNPESLFTGDTTVNLTGLVWKWAPGGNPKRTNVTLQAEYFQRREDGVYTLNPQTPDETAVNAKNGQAAAQTGWYAQARLQFLQRWRIGARHAAVKADAMKDAVAKGTVLDGGGKSPSITSAMVEFDPSEFSQIRLQYSSDRTRPDETVGRWFLQYIATFGAHAAHTY